MAPGAGAGADADAGAVGGRTCLGWEQSETGVGRLSQAGRVRKGRDSLLAGAVAEATGRQESVGRVSDRPLGDHLGWAEGHLR